MNRFSASTRTVRESMIVDRVEPLAQPASLPASEPDSLHTLAVLWARKYVTSLTNRDEAEILRRSQQKFEVASKDGRVTTAETLTRSLTLASAKAWSNTEQLLSGEIERHGINPNLVNPWQIAEDSHGLFKKCLHAYADRVTPRRLSVIVGRDFGRMRQKYTANDPRTLGFVSMQFHYTGTILLEQLSTAERSLFSPYLKVMDDHLYIPLQAAYEAAAGHDIDSMPLQAVQHLLPISTRIAHAVCEQVSRQRPTYISHSGKLTSPVVRVSSIRDVEMFQVYLCLCVLENSLRSVQQELFPLCVMLYPRLDVRWELVQEMLRALGWEMHERLSPEHLSIFLPYLRALTEMFSLEVLHSL